MPLCQSFLLAGQLPPSNLLSQPLRHGRLCGQVHYKEKNELGVGVWMGQSLTGLKSTVVRSGMCHVHQVEKKKGKIGVTDEF